MRAFNCTASPCNIRGQRAWLVSEGPMSGLVFSVFGGMEGTIGRS